MDKAEQTIDKAPTVTPIARGKPLPAGQRHIDLQVGGMTCAHCPPAVEKALAAVDGVVSAHVNLANRLASVDYDPNRAKVLDLAKAIRSAGYSAGAATMRLPIQSMHCSSCVTRIEAALVSRTPLPDFLREIMQRFH